MPDNDLWNPSALTSDIDYKWNYAVKNVSKDFWSKNVNNKQRKQQTKNQLEQLFNICNFVNIYVFSLILFLKIGFKYMAIFFADKSFLAT